MLPPQCRRGSDDSRGTLTRATPPATHLVEANFVEHLTPPLGHLLLVNLRALARRKAGGPGQRARAGDAHRRALQHAGGAAARPPQHASTQQQDVEQ